MNNQVEGLAMHAVENNIEQIDDIWLQHRMNGVRSFIKNVTVIDDEPLIKIGDVDFVDTPDDTGFNEGNIINIPNDLAELQPIDNSTGHSLDIRQVSDAFADEGVACAFVLPEKSHENEDESVIRRILKASNLSDMLIIDWFLRESNSALTRKVLTEIARQDRQENGRLRLICIYTGQEVNQGILDDSLAALAAGEIVLEQIPHGDRLVAKNSNCMLVVLSKNTQAHELPGILLKEFSELTDGVLPLFALAAVGAIRKNAHHMVTRFGRELDCAYVANRMITDPPQDVEELVRELFVSECDTAIGSAMIAEKFLSSEVIKNWIAAHDHPQNVRTYSCVNPSENVAIDQSSLENNIEVTIDRDFLNKLVDHGVSGDSVGSNNNGSTTPFPVGHRSLVAESLAPDPNAAKATERSFARFVAMRREAFGTRQHVGPPDWIPSLTTGTILGFTGNPPLSGSRFLICLTPSCDMLRLEGKRRFVFIGNSDGGGRYTLVVTKSNGQQERLYFDRKQPNLITIEFEPNGITQKICGESSILNNQPCFKFTSSDNKIFTWLGELRYMRAASDVAEVTRNFNRIGINDSEYLRLASLFSGW